MNREGCVLVSAPLLSLGVETRIAYLMGKDNHERRSAF